MIRPARPDEGPLLSALAFQSKAHWGYSNEFMEACRVELTVTDSDILEHDVMVLEDGEKVVGFYCLEALGSERPTVFELDHLFVEPPFIGRGYGGALMQHAMELALSKGCNKIVIQADPNAEPFYEANGAVRVGDKASASVSNRALPLMEVRLTPRSNPAAETPKR